MFATAILLLAASLLSYLVGWRWDSLGKVTKLIGTIGAVILFVLSVIQTFPEIRNQFSSGIFDKTQTAVIEFLLGFVGLLAFQSIAGWYLASSLIALIWRTSKKQLQLEILQRSKPHPGGFFVIEAKLQGRFLSAYLRASITNDYGQYISRYHLFDEKKQLGRISGISPPERKPFLFKLPLPQDFESGKCTIAVKVYDAYPILLGTNILPSRVKLKEETFEWNIESPSKGTVLIQKITPSELDGIASFSDSSKEGWICIKVFNDTDTSISGCIGKVTTEIGKYPICDYEGFLNQDGKESIQKYRRFSLTSNSANYLYAEIKTERKKALVNVDIGKEVITRELDIELDS